MFHHVYIAQNWFGEHISMQILTKHISDPSTLQTYKEPGTQKCSTSIDLITFKF